MLHHDRNFGTWDEYGYIICNDLIDDNLLNRVLVETKTESQDHQLDRWKRHESNAILELAYHKPILDILSDIYDARPFPFQTLNFDTSPGIALHADTIHFNTEPTGWMCGVWVALEDATLDNGPLQYFKGSHKLPVVTFESLELVPVKDKDIFHNNLKVYSTWLERRNARNNWTPETLVCKKGTVLIWHSNLMHKSLKPKPGTTRTTQVTHYYFDIPGVKYTVPAYGMIHQKNDAFAMERHYAELLRK